MVRKQIAGVGIAVVMIAVYFGIEAYATNVAEGKVNEAIAKVDGIADIDYGKVDVDLIGKDIRIEDILVSAAGHGKKIKIDEIVIHDMDVQSDVPEYLSMSCNGIALNLDELGTDAREFRELGYEGTIRVNLNADYVYDKEKKELDLRNFGIGATEAGEVSVSLRLGNIDLDPRQMMGLLFTFPRIVFHGARLKYDDDSLVERYMKLGARQQQMSLDDFRDTVVQAVDREIEMEKDEFTRKALTEIREFVANPKEISISASPSEPRSLGRIMQANDPKEMIRLLNLKIES